MAAEDGGMEQNHRLPGLVVGAVRREYHVDVVGAEREPDRRSRTRRIEAMNGFIRALFSLSPRIRYTVLFPLSPTLLNPWTLRLGMARPLWHDMRHR